MNFWQKIKNLDLVSKLLLVGILLIPIYISVNYFWQKDSTKTQTGGLLEVSKELDLKIRELTFETYSQDRFSDDMIAYIYFEGKDVTKENLEKLEIKISPDQEIKTSVIDFFIIKVEFLKPSPADRKLNSLIVLYNGKQVGRVEYVNLDFDSTGQVDSVPPYKK